MLYAGTEFGMYISFNTNGPVVVPGDYQIRATSGSWSQTQPLHIIEDPRVTKDGVTTADLQEQFDHNIRVLALLNDTNYLVSRLRDADKLLTSPIRYNQPGLQPHVAYLYSMNTRTDQKVGKDAVKRTPTCVSRSTRPQQS